MLDQAPEHGYVTIIKLVFPNGAGSMKKNIGAMFYRNAKRFQIVCALPRWKLALQLIAKPVD
jgi:hypothetical protein